MKHRSLPTPVRAGFDQSSTVSVAHLFAKPARTNPYTMENTQTLDLITGGIAIAILIGGYLMMFTDVFTRKKK
jgi:hypothetical protein